MYDRCERVKRKRDDIWKEHAIDVQIVDDQTIKTIEMA